MRIHRKLITKLLCALMCIMGIAAVSPLCCFASENESKTVKVAYVISPGYQEGTEGEYKTGYGFEYLQRIAGFNNWKYEYVYGSFSDLLDKLKHGEIDLMGNLSYTDERAKSISYGAYEQGKEYFYVYTTGSSTIDASDYSTLDGKRVGVSAGSYQKDVWEDWCRERGISTEIVEYGKYTERYDALNKGEIDATVAGIVHQEAETSGWKVVASIYSAPFYFGVSKSRPDLLDEVNDAQKWILEENPFYNEEIYDRYMRTLALTTITLDEEEKEWLSEHDNKIMVGYLDGYQPVSYSDENGNFKGVAADVLESIEQQYADEGIQFETVSFQDYDAMISALKNGEISVCWPIYMDYWNADQKGIALTKQVMSTSMMIVFKGDYSPETADRIGVSRKGSLPKVYARINYPHSTLVEYDSYDDAAAAVLNGEVTSVLYEASILQVNEATNDIFDTLNQVTLQNSFGLTFAVAPKDRYITSILDKGITAFGDAGINRSLLTNSTVDKKITFMDYLMHNPAVTIGLVSIFVAVIAGAIILTAYIRMSVRVKTSQAEKQVYEKLSNSDTLTGLYNRKAVFGKCRKLLEEYPDEKFVMAHIDMVHFRLYNTFYGEEAGDRLLCDVADYLRKISEDYDHWAYGRIEADVFCAFFPYDEKMYKKHLSGITDFFRECRSDFHIVPKLGLYFITDPEMPIEAMFTRATLASREVMLGTPDNTVVYNNRLEKELNEKQQVTNEMQAAVDKEQFEVYLQPKYSLRSNRMVGAEALVRWNHPTKGMISPGIFIPVFEGNGFITTLDRYMWEHVCMLLSKWKKEGKPMVPVSVNVSRLSMFGSTTVEFLKELIREYDIDAGYLELEITESAYMDDPEEMKKQMLALRDAGFVILLDDFGSGYSSLNTLREMPIDVLKMDMKFLAFDQTDIRGGLVVSSVVRMAELLNLTVVAEGVETREQADFLKGVGCEYVQGFLFSKPVPVPECEKLLTAGNRPLRHVNQPTIEHIGKIIAETGSSTYAMGTVIPSPLACIEYIDHDFAFLRVNPAFYSEFGGFGEKDSITETFRKRMVEASFTDFVQAIEESIGSGAKVRVPIVLDIDDETQNRYICSVVYEGNVGASAALVVTFDNVTDVFNAECMDHSEKHSSEVERRLWNCVKDLVSATDLNTVANNTLGDVRAYYDADRAYIFEFDWEKRICINTFETCAPNVRPVIDTLQAVPVEIMGVWLRLFSSKSLIHIKDLNALKDDDRRKEEYEMLSEQGITSLIAVPVFSEDKLAGFLGVDNPRSNIEDTSVIESLAFFCVNESIRARGITNLEEMSLKDPLTGAYNRNAWDRKRKELLKNNTPFSVVMVDVDNYKQVNDTYGHTVGDDVLKNITSALKGIFRADDLIIRYGGDEFLIILENTGSWMEEVLTQKIDRLNMLLSQSADKRPAVTVSVGIAFSDECDVDSLLDNADNALYYVKNNGKKGWHVFGNEQKTPGE